MLNNRNYLKPIRAFRQNGFVATPPARWTWENVMSGFADFIIMVTVTMAFALITLIAGL